MGSREEILPKNAQNFINNSISFSLISKLQQYQIL